MSAKEVWVLILGIICVILCYFLANSSVNMNFYEISMGDKKVNYYVIEDVKKMYIEDVIEINKENKAYFNNGVFDVNLDDLNLSVRTLDCTDSKGKANCKVQYSSNNNFIFTDKGVAPSKLIVMKDEKTLYDGDYITDLSSIIKEKGRYYFIVNIKEKAMRTVRNIKLLFFVKVSG